MSDNKPADTRHPPGTPHRRADRGQLRGHASAADAVGGHHRRRPLLLLLRRALHHRLPHRHRHPGIHPEDPQRQSQGLGAHHPQRKHHGRHVRARVSDRGAVRGGLRAQHARRPAGAHRPAAALRHGRRLRKRHSAVRARAGHRTQGRHRRRRSRGTLPARIASPCWDTSATIFEPMDKLGGLNEYGIAAYKTVG